MWFAAGQRATQALKDQYKLVMCPKWQQWPSVNFTTICPVEWAHTDLGMRGILLLFLPIPPYL